jgi:hypothetical protein
MLYGCFKPSISVSGQYNVSELNRSTKRKSNQLIAESSNQSTAKHTRYFQPITRGLGSTSDLSGLDR